ncbi:MAG: ROK family protein [Acidobacteriota bacterium]
MDYKNDKRIVLTLDAGGTNFVFSAISGNEEIVKPIIYPSFGDDLEKCLSTIINGFKQIKAKIKSEPAAISFAFPGPADYPAGIIGDLWNLPGFKGGVALGPMLEDIFKVPAFINNDGNLFVYGEAIAGFLPYINRLMEENGSGKRFKNLFGVTLGTGFGGGFVMDGKLLVGDNSCGGEIWLLNHGFEEDKNVEESLSIRGLKNFYSADTGIDPEEAPEPLEIYKIANGEMKGDKDAAKRSFTSFGKVLGDTLSSVVTLFDSLIVIGGGLSGASGVFLNETVAEMNGVFHSEGKNIKKMEVTAFNLEDKNETDKFIKGEKREIDIPFSDKKVIYDPLQRVGVGISRLGTSKAVSIGAYSFALSEIDRKI